MHDSKKGTALVYLSVKFIAVVTNSASAPGWMAFGRLEHLSLVHFLTQCNEAPALSPKSPVGRITLAWASSKCMQSRTISQRSDSILVWRPGFHFPCQLATPMQAKKGFFRAKMHVPYDRRNASVILDPRRS